MLPSPAPWETRFHRTIVIGQWVAFAIGVISSLVQTRGGGTALFAVAVSGVYVITTSLLRVTFLRSRFGADAIALGGTAMMMIALTLTGGAQSPYLLLSMGPPVFATTYGGLRPGLLSGILSGSMLIFITLAQRGDLLTAGPPVALYIVFVILVGVIRRILVDIHSQAEILAAEKETATQRLERLETIHQSLVRLSEDMSLGRLNAIEVGADTLDEILERFPGSSGKLVVEGGDGSVVVAARGIPEDEGHIYELPMTTSDRPVGKLELTSPSPLSDDEISDLTAGLHPAAVAFANLQLLQDIVGSAVSEERTRLAREMHDEIGPSLASLGLALDMAAMQQAGQPELAADLHVLRSNVTKLVEDVRASVADLRTAPGPTLTARVLDTVGNMDGKPPIIVDLDERRPPRANQISELTAILTEAARNAHRHSKASKVVISGHVDRAYGSCSVVDDGVGFDPDQRPEGHYGLIGMGERAAKIGATLKVESKPGVGTAVTVEWGSK